MAGAATINILLAMLAVGMHLRPAADACAATAANSPPITSSPTKSAQGGSTEQVTTSGSSSPPTTTGGNAAVNGSACGMCPRVVIRMNDTNSRPVTQTPGTRPNGCSTNTVMCEGTASDAAVILTWYDSQGNEVGSTFGSGTVQAVSWGRRSERAPYNPIAKVLICNRRNQLVLEGGVVNQVECISDSA